VIQCKAALKRFKSVIVQVRVDSVPLYRPSIIKLVQFGYKAALQKTVMSSSSSVSSHTTASVQSDQ